MNRMVRSRYVCVMTLQGTQPFKKASVMEILHRNQLFGIDLPGKRKLAPQNLG